MSTAANPFAAEAPTRTAHAIWNKITAGLAPVHHLQVINESHMHVVPKDAETHFKTVIVSDAFEKKTPLARHRMVHQLLDEELQGGVHALSIVAKTSAQWDASAKAVDPSPNCMGGDGRRKVGVE